jgi:hypothetical protein
MSYQRADGRFVYSEKYTLASAVVTASGNSPSVDVGSAAVLRGAVITASAVGGTTPSLTIQPQTSPDNTNWTNVGTAFAALTANGSTAAKTVGPLDRYFRLNYTVTGTTPTLTIVGTGDLV